MRVGRLAAALLVAALAGCAQVPPTGYGPGASPPAALPSRPADPSAAPEASASAGAPTARESASPPSGQAVPTRDVTVYFPRRSTTGIRLGRELRPVPAADPLRGALQAMLDGPLDPDYFDGWAEGTRVLDADVEAGVVTVDLSAEARQARLGPEASTALVDGVVFTATDMVGTDARVLLLIEGAPAGEFRDGVSWDQPFERADPWFARVLASIDQPLQGAVVRAPVRVIGDAAASGPALPWRVLDAEGELVEEGAVAVQESSRFHQYTFEVDLPPGRHTVEVGEPDPSDGEGREPDVDTRTIVVER